MISSEMINHPLGPEFQVTAAADINPDAKGWIITHRKSGRFIETGIGMTIQGAAGRLLTELAREEIPVNR
ncbi:MAG TPA: hypothetical protein VKW08_07670 [Xanthobacteraceae bacterium]|nr:hypothetical protein [Xanthobacteraceae bacterium]